MPKPQGPTRSYSTFMTHSAMDSGNELARRSSIAAPSQEEGSTVRRLARSNGGFETAEEERRHDTASSDGLYHRLLSYIIPDRKSDSDEVGQKGHRRSRAGSILADNSLAACIHPQSGSTAKDEGASKLKSGLGPRPVGGSAKLSTFTGVFVPTTLNVLSILMFLRFGFILGQSGVVGMMGMLLACYIINLFTTMSLSAIATNGTVRGGGAYYLISRSLGPEFGGSIGIVFYLGFVLNTGLNAVGLIDCVKNNFGEARGNWGQWLPEGYWTEYLCASGVLLLCTAICLAGSGLFARASNGLLVLLLVATFSIPFSAFIRQPFESRRLGIEYTGLSLDTFRGNLMPRLTKGAAGSQFKKKETFQDLFGILFPATGGIFAGASMSGDLKNPSKAIPKGTLYGLAVTFLSYSVVILAMAATITRASFYQNVNVIQDVNISGVLILLGEFATTFFSALMGVIGSAKALQALARDNLIPGLSVFGQGTKGKDEPIFAILLTHVIAQLTMLSDLNHIASFITMTYLMTFLVMNLACFLLTIGAAPNFRPSFHFFNWWTAALGTILSGASMFFVDRLYASACIAILMLLFLVIHYTTPPKPWGDVSQGLIYHQVRKYLLRLRQEHVKFWRPQILLFVNDPRRSFKLIQFCNSLKKGALFVLGHVIVTQDFAGAVPEARKQQTAWTKYINFSKIKAFVNIAISPGVEWGARNVALSAGLGGMRPNIVVMGFYNLTELRSTKPPGDIPTPQPSRLASHAGMNQKTRGSGSERKRRQSRDGRLRGQLPTDSMRAEGSVTAQSYLTILEDFLLRLQINMAIAKGFSELELPAPRPSKLERALSFLHLASYEEEEKSKKFIDLWPIQMSAEIPSEPGDSKQNVLTTNFDTYTLILQLGCILHTVPAWKRAYKLRVAVFVEYESDILEEKGRVETLLSNLRIEAKVLVFWLASGDLTSYEIIVNGKEGDVDSEGVQDVEEVLKEEEWWQDIKKVREWHGNISDSQELADGEGWLSAANQWPGQSFQNDNGGSPTRTEKLENLKRALVDPRRRSSIAGLGHLGVSMSMRTHKLDPELVSRHGGSGSVSSDTNSDDSASTTSAVSDGEDSEESAASENDLDQFDDGYGPRRPLISRVTSRSRSVGEGRNALATRKHAGRRTPLTMSSAFRDSMQSQHNPFQPRSEDVASAAASAAPSTSPPLITLNEGDVSPLSAPPSRPPMMRQSSMPKFSSRTVPRTKISMEDGPGPSIMFADAPSPPSQRPRHSIYAYPFPSAAAHSSPLARTSTSASSSHPSSPPQPSGGASPSAATGYPSSPSIPLSFNDLPCRAQHLILNELFRQNSADTAVVFTTLPSPIEGTCKSEEESVRFLSDLEVLCQGLPPVMLVHSNSMTVTMNL